MVERIDTDLYEPILPKAGIRWESDRKPPSETDKAQPRKDPDEDGKSEKDKSPDPENPREKALNPEKKEENKRKHIDILV